MEDAYSTEDLGSVIADIPKEPPQGDDLDSLIAEIPKDEPQFAWQDTSLKDKMPDQVPTSKGTYTSWNSEEAQNNAAKALAYMSLTGEKDPSKIGPLMDLKPEDAPQDYSLLEAVEYHAKNFKHSINSNIKMLEAGRAYTYAMASGDNKAKQEALQAFIASQAPMEGSEKVPENVKKGWMTDISEGLGSILGSLGYTYGQAGSQEAAIGAATGALGGAMISGPIGAAVAAIGTGFLTTYGTAAIGVHSLSMQAQGVDPETADKVAIVTGSLEALLEQLQMGTFAKAIPGANKVLEGFTKKYLEKTLMGKLVQLGAGAVKTGVEETAVELTQNFAQELGANYARELTNELRENTNLDVKTIEQIGKETLQQAQHILPSMIIMGGATRGIGLAGHTVGATAKTMVRKAAERQVSETAQMQATISETEQAPVETELRDATGAEVDVESAAPSPPQGAAGVVDDTGTQQPAVPITPVERAKQELDWEESPINDQEFDQVVASGSEESIDEMVDRDLTVAREEGEYYGDFMASVRSVLPKKQAKAVDKILEARARATNRTKEQFAKDHKLVMRPGEKGEGGAIEFVKDGETIIRAFQNTALSDVVHELGHVFRKDLSEAELTAAEKAIGVEDGNWTTQKEEQFANGFTEYLATGDAPTKGLRTVFEKLKTWLGNVVTALKGERIPLSPEMEQFYAEMLTNQRDKAYQHVIAQAQAETEQTLYAPRKKSVKTQSREATGQTPTRAGKYVDEYVAFKEGLKRRAADARAAMRAGNKEGYAKAKAEYKAMVRRARNRSAQTKSRAKMRDRITKLVKRQKVKKQSGKPKGKFTASFQEQADNLIRIMNMPVKEAKALAKKMAAEIPLDYGTWYDKLERQVLETRANMPNMDETALRALHDDLQTFFDYGQELRAQELADSMRRIEDAKRKIKASLDSVARRKGLDPRERGAYENRVNAFRKAWDKLLLNTLYDFTGLMEKIDMGLRDAIGEGAARTFTELIDAQVGSRKGMRDKSRQIMLEAAKIYGFAGKDEETRIGLAKRYFWKEERAGKKQILTVDVIDKEGNATGERITLNLTHAELRNLWMELQDPEVEKVWKDIGLTEEHKRVILGHLNEKDLEFIKTQLSIYDQYYDEINEVYRYIYGTNLERRKNYSPILRDITKLSAENVVDDLLAQLRPVEYRGVGAGSLKSRVSSTAVTQPRSDIGKFNFYVRQMEHFKAFAPKMREVNMVFRDKEIQKAIKNTYGDEFYTVLDKLLGNIIKGGTSVDYENWLNRAARTIRANLARGMVGMKPLAMVKQLTSAVGYVSEMPVTDFMDGLAEFLKDPKKHMQELYELSDFIKTRGETIDRDIAALYKTSEFGGIISKRLPSSFNNVVMMFVKAGDVGAIYAGGYSYYRYLVKNGMSKAEAIRKMEIVTRQTQQSSDLTNLSMAQQGPEFLQLFTMFTTSPRQYAQKTMLALEAAINKRMTPQEAAKQFIVYAVALPVLFQIASQVGSTDDEALRSYLKAILTSPLKMIPLVGQMADFLGSLIIEKTDYGRSMGDIPIFSPAGETAKGLKKLTKDDISYEDIMRALRQVAAFTEYAGIPGRQAVNVAIGLSDIGQGEAARGALELGGVSPYSAARRVK